MSASISLRSTFYLERVDSQHYFAWHGFVRHGLGEAEPCPPYEPKSETSNGITASFRLAPTATRSFDCRRSPLLHSARLRTSQWLRSPSTQAVLA